MPNARRSPSGLGLTLARYALVRVRGVSMRPTLGDGDLLVVRVGVVPRVGSLVVVRLPGRPGVAIKRATRRDADGWWVERDNPDAGVDSWAVGAVPESDMVAEVVTRLWPPRRIEDPPTL